MLLGIRLHMNSQGVVSGASLAEGSLDKVAAKAESTQARVSKSAMGMSQAMQAAGGLGMIGVAAIGAGNMVENNFFKPMMENTKSFETEMKQLQFVTQATGDELERLKDFALETGRVTQFAPNEAARAIRMLKAAGLETDTALSSLNATLDVVTGSAGMLDLQTGATATAAALLKFKRTGEDARQIMDSFSQATRETNLQFQDLPIVLRSMRDAPSRLKMSASEAFALAGAMKNAGLTAAQAGQAVAGLGRKLIINQRMVERFLEKKGMSETDLLNRLADDVGKMPMKAKAFKQFGVQVFDTVTGKLRPMSSIIQDIIKQSEKLSGESEKKFLTTASTLFGEQAGAMISALRLMRRGGKMGAEAYMDLVNALKESQGASRDAAAAIEDTQVGLEKFIQGTKETIAIAFGEHVLPMMFGFHSILREVLNVVLEFVKANPSFAKALGVTITLLGTLLKIAGGMAIAFAGWLMWTNLIGPALGGLSMWTSMAVAGIEVLQFAIAKLLPMAAGLLIWFGLLYGAIKLWDKVWAEDATGIFKSIQDVFTDIKLVFQGFFDWMDGKSDDMDLYNRLEQRGLTGVVMRLLQVRDRIVEIMSGLFDTLFMPLRALWGVLSSIGGAFGTVISFLREFLGVAKATSIESELPYWRSFGEILGYLGWVIIPVLLIKMALWLQATLAQTAAMIVQNAVMLVAIAKYALIAAGILLIAAAYAVTLVQLAKWGKKLGIELHKLTEDVAGWMGRTLTKVKRWGAELGTAVLEAFKGNFEPIFKMLDESILYLEKLWGYLTGDVTADQLSMFVPDAFKMSTEEEIAADRAGVNALNTALGGGGSARDPKHLEKLESKRMATQEFAAIMRDLKSQDTFGRQVTINKIELAAEGQSPEEALRLAKEIMQQVAEQGDEEAEASFAPV